MPVRCGKSLTNRKRRGSTMSGKCSVNLLWTVLSVLVLGARVVMTNVSSFVRVSLFGSISVRVMHDRCSNLVLTLVSLTWKLCIPTRRLW